MFRNKIVATGLRSTLVGFIALAMLLFTAGLPANASFASNPATQAAPAAAEVDPGVAAYQKALESDIKLTPENIRQAMTELDAAEIPAESNADGSKSYEVSDGITVTLGSGPIPKNDITAKGDVMVPMIGGGMEGNGFYITLNPTDQAALTNGSAAAIGAALCAIPAVGWAACGVIAVVLAIATTYVNAHGLCSNKRSLKLNADWAGNVNNTRCI